MEMTMSIATATAAILSEAGISARDILNDAGVDSADAIKALADKLGVNLNDLVEAPAQPEAAVEIQPVDVEKVREGLAVLNRAFS